MENKNSIIESFNMGQELDNYMFIKLKSKSENEKLARNLVASFLIDSNPSVELLNDVKTAVSEAVTNSIVHGYGHSTGEILIEAKLKGDNIYIKIEDSGVGIKDIKEAMQPFFTTGKEGERSGMGFTVMETFMDEIKVYNKTEGTGLVVEMAKQLKAGYDN